MPSDRMRRSAAKSPGTNQESGLSWTEVLVALAIVGILYLLALPKIVTAFARGPCGPMLSNMKQLQLATQQMAADGETNGDRTLGWPGDTGGTFTNWGRQLVPAYLSMNDFCKLLSGAGIIVPQDRVPQKMSECAILVYAVSRNSPDSAVFFSSANFTNTASGGEPLQEDAQPLGNTSFVVLRKGGDGAILLKKQTGQTNAIGSYVPLLR